MIDKKVEAAFNEQINAEMYSAYLYLAMSAWSQEQNLPGFGGWMQAQAMEEMTHAMKLYHHIIERGGRVVLGAIDKPPIGWASPLAMFEAVLEHEQKVTGLINGLVDVAEAQKDRAAGIFLQWFVTEQVEEEASADAVIQQLKMMGDAPHALFMMDRELGKRPAAGGGGGGGE
ncbi:MAG: ferritin [Phycisphaerae bacterium]|nr:ferritin [Phycisphaerae bacterium]